MIGHPIDVVKAAPHENTEALSTSDGHFIRRVCALMGNARYLVPSMETFSLATSIILGPYSPDY